MNDKTQYTPKPEELIKVWDSDVSNKFIPKKGDTILVWQHRSNESFAVEQKFIEMSSGYYVCKSEVNLSGHAAWGYAKPLDKDEGPIWE